MIVVCILFSFKTQAQVIRALFNHPVNTSTSPYTNGVYSPNIEDTIVAVINSANTSIDIAVWDNGSSKILTALNNAYSRGVTVRYISSSNSLNTALSSLNSNIPVLTR